MGWVVNVTPRLLYPRDVPGTHCIGGWVGPRAGLNRWGRSPPPRGFDPRTIQPVASRYTDWSYPSPKRVQGFGKLRLCVVLGLAAWIRAMMASFIVDIFFLPRFISSVLVKRVGKGKFGSLPVCLLARKTSARILSSLVCLFTPLKYIHLL